MNSIFVCGLSLLVLIVCGCESAPVDTSEKEKDQPVKETQVKDADDKTETKEKPALETVSLGAGCFWCIEAVLERVKGVHEVVSGYQGGQVPNPTYEQICTGLTGHAEVVEVKFDPKVISFEKLLDVFWQLHDPTQLNRQGPDFGTQYRSAIFYYTDEQKELAVKSKKKWDDSGKFSRPIVTEITKAPTFYVAEEKHQDFYSRNPNYAYCRVNIPPKLKKLGLLRDND